MSLKVVILGAGGLVGTRLCLKIVQLQEMHINPTESLPLKKIVMFDAMELKTIPDSIKGDARVSVMIGDLCDKTIMAKAVEPDGCTRVTVIHLAAVLSGYAEENFDLGMKVNLHGTLNVMECMRGLVTELGQPQIYVYVSTDYVCCFNDYNKNNPVNEESFRLSPVSYGIQKSCIELLMCDYTRKGFLDGRVARLSAVIGRPGWSNSISYPYTGIFTQPLEGKDYVVPLPMDIPFPCSSLNNNIDCLLFTASNLDGTKLGHNRIIQLPAKSWTLNDIWAATKEVASEEGVQLGKITNQSNGGDTTIKEINVCPYVDCGKAERLGYPMEVDLKDIIRDYINVYIKK
ncbi:unnamed protein product [Owenia fusiformis]|uniref:Uncharacterized protein n=1 Tax=Owenia fusiformis TaxID=6347 RepID=A0A8J1UC96_OWEFU|nr:unnamed protein product [Owenia fusiformis]